MRQTVCLLLRSAFLGLIYVSNASAQPFDAALPPGFVVSSGRVDAGWMVGVDLFDSAEIRLDPLEDNASPPVITALAASHDGRYLAAAGDDHSIRVVDVTTGKTFATLTGHSDWIQSVVFSSDSHELYSAGNDGRVLKWNHQYPVTSEVVFELGFAIRSISVSTERQLLAAGGFSDEVFVWDLQNGQTKLRLKCDSQDQRCVRFSPDGNRLLRAGRLGEICVWETDSGRELAHYSEHRRRVFTAAFSAEGDAVTSVGEDRRIVRYDLATQQVTMSSEVPSAKLMSMCLINDSLVAAAGADNLIHMFDLNAGEFVAHLRGHSGTVAVMVPCGNYLASGSFDTTIRIWDLERIGKRSSGIGRPVRTPLQMDAKLQIR